MSARAALRAAMLLGLTLGSVLPAAAAADSIVYVREGDVWIAHGDGSGARQFTAGHMWSSPSEADDGTVAAIGPHEPDTDGRTRPGSRVYRFRGDGTLIAPVAGAGSWTSPGCTSPGPYAARISPDGSRLAFEAFDCVERRVFTTWTPVAATSPEAPSQPLLLHDYGSPSWVDSTRFVVSRFGPPSADGQSRWLLHDVAADDQVGSGWSESRMDAPAAQAVVSRDGRRMAVFTNDAASWHDGRPRSVEIWLYASRHAGAPGPGQDWDPQCPAEGGTPISLGATAVSQLSNLYPSFSPDGSKLLWGDDRGVEVAAVPAGADCSGFTPQLLIPGGSQPFFARGDLQAAATVVTLPSAPPPPAVKPRAAFTVVGKRPSTRRKVVFSAGASRARGTRIVAYRWSFGDHHAARGRRVSHRFRKAKTYRVTLTVVDARGTQASVTHLVRVRRR